MDTIVTPVTVITLDSTRIVHSIKADLVARYFPPVVRLVQYDQSLPVIAVSLMQNGQAYTLPSGAAANIRVHKPDSTYVYNPALGCDSTRKIVYFEVTQAMAAASGDGLAIVEIVVDGDIAGTSLITLHFEENPVPEDAIESSDEWETIYELGERIIASTVTPVSTAAGMTDHNVVYLYTGTESGWNQGHMYYYNGTTWVDAGIAVTDTTLSVAGLAADAKKTGDEIADLKDGLSDLETQIIATLVTDTASGSIASFPDGADGVPVKSLTVDIEPVQDLHGQANPYPAGGGKNLCPLTVAGIKALNASGTWSGNVCTLNSVSFTILTDNDNNVIGIQVNGTPSANTTFIVAHYTGENLGFILNGCPSGGSDSKYRLTANSGGNDYGSGVNIGSGWNGYVSIYIYAQVSNIIFKPMVRLSTVSDATFAPYENICPITGHTSATVTRTGANVWDEVWELGAVLNSNGQNADGYTDRIRSKNYIPVMPNTQYYVYGGTQAVMYKRFYDANKNYLGSAYSLDTSMNSAFNTPDNAYYMRFNLAPAYGTTYKTDISVNYPATVHEYNAYDGQTVTIDLDGTRYGGTLDVGTGVLTVDRVAYTFTNGTGLTEGTDGNVDWLCVKHQISSDLWDTNTRTQNICSHAPFTFANVNGQPHFYTTRNIFQLFVPKSVYASLSAFTSSLATNPLTFVAMLSTPTTVQLTANELKTVLGQNNIWNDCGDTAVEYRADTKLYIQKVLNG